MKKLLLLCFIALPLTVKAALPIQPPIADPLYSKYREWAYAQINPTLDQCAKFVNRMLLTRFGISSYGDAWNLQLAPENQAYFDLLWRVDEADFDRKNDFKLYDYTSRIKHFEQLYKKLDQDNAPIGVLGFMYYYSQHKEKIPNGRYDLPQTHVAFLAGRDTFPIFNHTDTTLSVEDLLALQHGQIWDFERPFVLSRIPLEQRLAPGETLTYEDYLVEDQFKTSRNTSLLNIFLDKHWYNRKTPLLRPVSYSRLKENIVEAVQQQRWQLESLGPITYVSGAAFESIPFPTKDPWKERLGSVFQSLNKKSWKDIPVVPIPKY